MTVTPENYQPPLNWWSHTWRLLLVALMSALGLSVYWVRLWNERPLWLLLDLGIGLAVLILVMWRRRFPVTVNLIANAAPAISITAGGPAALALVSLSTRRRWREIIPIALLSIVCGVIQYFVVEDPEENLTLWVGITVIAIAAIVAWGLFIGSRRELLATLRDRADRAESEQSARIEKARTGERTRIAREMHDVLAHRISIVSMHAGALAYRTDLDAEQMREALGIIQENSHEALVELREVLGVLRGDPGDAQPELPQPDAGDISRLVADAQRSGIRIHTAFSVDLDDVPDTTGRTIFRVIQEAITNLAKHAPQTQLTLQIEGDVENGITVVASNPMPLRHVTHTVPSSGLGLVGLHERLVLVGGHMSTELTPEQVFIVRAWLPWRP